MEENNYKIIKINNEMEENNYKIIKITIKYLKTIH